MDYATTLLFAAGGKVETPVDGQTGVWIKSAGVTISSAMRMTGAVIDSTRSMTIYSYGRAENSVLLNGGRCIVSGGVLSNTSISAAIGSSYIDLYSGGILDGLSGSAGGCRLGISSSFAINLSSPMLINVHAGGKLINFSQYGGFSETVPRNGATLISGSAATFYCAGRDNMLFSAVFITNTNPTLNVGRGCYAADCFVLGEPYNISSGVLSGFVMSGGNLTVFAGATAINCTISKGALSVSPQVTVSSITVESGGSLTVSSGGTALAVTSNAGATVTVLNGGYIEYA